MIFMLGTIELYFFSEIMELWFLFIWKDKTFEIRNVANWNWGIGNWNIALRCTGFFFFTFNMCLFLLINIYHICSCYWFSTMRISNIVRVEIINYSCFERPYGLICSKMDFVGIWNWFSCFLFTVGIMFAEVNPFLSLCLF